LHTTDVDEPERREVDDEAQREADAHREEDAQREREPGDGMLRDLEVEDQRAGEERRDPAKERVVHRASEVQRQPIELIVEGTVEIGRDLAGVDGVRDLVPRPQEQRHDQTLGDEAVCDGIVRGVTTESARLFAHIAELEQREQDVGAHEPEDGVREHAGDRRPAIGRVASEAPARDLPPQAHLVPPAGASRAV
jgi:hypothetical protein